MPCVYLRFVLQAYVTEYVTRMFVLSVARLFQATHQQRTRQHVILATHSTSHGDESTLRAPVYVPRGGHVRVR